MVRNVFKPTDGRGVLVLLGVIFGGVTLILVLIAAGLVLRTWSFLGNAESATGTVVALTPRQTCSDNDNDKNRMSCSTVYAPLVRFTTADGREIEGLSAIVQRRGARSVIASLWRVEDQSTASLMRRMYDEMAAHTDVARALQLAQLSLADRHPYYWAGFLLAGSSR